MGGIQLVEAYEPQIETESHKTPNTKPLKTLKTNREELSLKRMEMDLSENNLDFVVNHVFLPLRLPNGEDEDLWEKEWSLLRLVQSLAGQFAAQSTPESLAQWRPIITMIQTWIHVYRLGDISRESLETTLKGLKIDGRSS